MPKSIPGKILKNKVADIKVKEKSSNDEIVIYIDKGHSHEALTLLKNHPETLYNFLADLTVVDYYPSTPRFEVIYQLYSIKFNRSLRLKLRVSEKKPTVESVCDIWRGANWLEREAWDMYGIKFENHPNLTRLLLYEEFEGHPLRKDYPIMKMQPIIQMLRPLPIVEEYKEVEID